MRRTLIVVLLTAGLLAAAARDRAQQAQPPRTQEPAPQQSPEKIVREINLVDVLFTVLNRRNKLVPDLGKESFKVTDDGTMQDIRYFSRQTDLQLRIGMLLDTSNSIRDRIQFEKDAAINFLFNVVRRGKDQSFLMTFDDQPYVQQTFTDDTGKLRDEIFKLKAGGGTAVYDAIYAACKDQLSHPPRPAGDQPDVVRRVMVLISDGDDNQSEHTRAEAIEMAQRTSVVIYTISTSTQWVTLAETDKGKTSERKIHKTEGDQILQDIAEETGGRAFFPYHVDDLDQSFLDIGDELRSQYSLAYNPTNYAANGKYHKIRIEVVDRKGLQVRARRGYFARKAGTPPAKPAGN
jgi:Ca-activated chloride channel family protein